MKKLKNIEEWAINTLPPEQRNTLLIMLGEVLEEQTELVREFIALYKTNKN